MSEISRSGSSSGSSKSNKSKRILVFGSEGQSPDDGEIVQDDEFNDTTTSSGDIGARNGNSSGVDPTIERALDDVDDLGAIVDGLGGTGMETPTNTNTRALGGRGSGAHTHRTFEDFSDISETSDTSSADGETKHNNGKFADSHSAVLCCMPLVAKRPALTCSALMVVLGVLTGLTFVLSTLTVDVSIDSFSLDTSHFSVQHQDGLGAARSEWSTQIDNYNDGRRALSYVEQQQQQQQQEEEEVVNRNGNTNGNTNGNARAAEFGVGPWHLEQHAMARRKLSTQYLLGYFEVLYMPREQSDNESELVDFLTEENFERIHALETKIMQTENFTKYCMGSGLYDEDFTGTVADLDYTTCDPPSSIMSYFYPSVDNVTGNVVYDGYGDSMLPFSLTLSVLAGVEAAYSFLSSGSSYANKDSTFVKTLITFAIPYDRDSDEFNQLKPEWQTWMEYLSQCVGCLRLWTI